MPYEVIFWPDPEVAGRQRGWISAFNVEVAGDGQDDLEQRVYSAIASRGGDPTRGVRFVLGKPPN